VDARRRRVHDCLVRLADGDRSAFDPLFAEAWPLVRDLCRRALGDAVDADDAAQEAMIRVLSRAPEFDATRDATTWILAIAGWECRTVRRRRARRRDAPAAVDDHAALDAAPDAIAERRALLDAAARVLGELSPVDAETLAAAWCDDASARGDLAPATFRKRLERALVRFRAAWRSRHGMS
jgi:RNA polymerase sigma-70 factor (ECF subfamily)